MQTSPEIDRRDADAPLRAGVAKSEITTREKGVAVNDPLYARVLLLDDGATTVVIIAMDALAIGGIGDINDEFLPRLRARIESELKIPGRHVLVNASHTHPPGRILCDAGELVEKTFEAVRQALENLTPVNIGSGSGCEERISMNRNLQLRNGKHWTVRHANPCPPDEEVVGMEPIDPEVGVLRIDRLDGRPLAVVYNFACHLLFGDPQGSVTANLPGIASRVIEEDWGGGVMALFLQGAAGDVVDADFKNFDTPRNIEPLGVMLGRSVLKTLRTISTGDVALNVISKTVKFPRRTDIPQRIAALRQEQGDLLESLRTTRLNFKSFLPLFLKHTLSPDFPMGESYNYLQAGRRNDNGRTAMGLFNGAAVDKFLANIHAMEKLVRIQEDIATFKIHQAFNDESGEATIAAEVMGIKIGECILLSAPLEVLTEVGLNVKAASAYQHTFVAAYSNGYLQYGPPAAHYDKGGYEATECFLAPEWQTVFEDAADEIIRQL